MLAFSALAAVILRVVAEVTAVCNILSAVHSNIVVKLDQMGGKAENAAVLRLSLEGLGGPTITQESTRPSRILTGQCCVVSMVDMVKYPEFENFGGWKWTGDKS
jgi:hypothetical protein